MADEMEIWFDRGVTDGLPVVPPTRERVERMLQATSRAREALVQLGDVRAASLYRTAPIGPVQPSFVNTAIRLEIADATPAELLATIRELERMLGRERSAEIRWGPRTIDRHHDTETGCEPGSASAA